ncbi:MAG: Ig-like domain-containing protein [Maribacter arcticus]|uniref:Ig-like domain-containing protein n=1 Tax=Maribacter arcticus TaxID=561365 RepID=UPI0030011410
MNYPNTYLRILSTSLFFTLFMVSCSKDSDLLSEYVVISNNEISEHTLLNNDVFTTTANSSLNLDVLSNDNIGTDQNVVIISITQPKIGNVEINENNTLKFVPNVTEETPITEDTFTYTVEVDTPSTPETPISNQTAEVTIKVDNDGTPKVFFSNFCNNCADDVSNALQSAFNAMNTGDTFEFDTDISLTYLMTSQVTIRVPGTYNFNSRLLKRKDNTNSFYGDIVCVQSNVTFNDFNWDGNEANSSDARPMGAFGVKTAIAFSNNSNVVMNNTKIINTRQMAFAGGKLTDFRVIGAEFENIGEHVYYFASGLSGTNNLWQDIKVGEFGTEIENVNRNIEFLKMPSNSSSNSALRTLRNITFNMPENPGGSIRNIISNTIFNGEVWENIDASNATSFYALYATDDPSTLTIRDSNFGQNDIFLRVVGQVQAEDNYQNANANIIACALVVENTTAAIGRLTNVIQSWSGGKIYIKNPKEVNVADKRNYETSMNFCNVDMIFETSMSLHDIRGNVIFNGVRFISNNATTILDIGDSTGRSGTIRFKNCTIDVDNSLFLTNSYGGSINAIFENTNNYISHSGLDSNGLTNGGINIEVDAQSTGGVSCL